MTRAIPFLLKLLETVDTGHQFVEGVRRELAETLEQAKTISRTLARASAKSPETLT